MDDRIRVFFAACDADLRGRIFYADLSLEFPYPLLSINREPCLDLGPPAAFDADGVNPSCLLQGGGGELILYYIGWRRCSPEIPYMLIAGRATSINAGRSFERVNGPVLPPTEAGPLFRTAPFVWRAAENWQMLYIEGGQFFTGPDGRLLPIYALRAAESNDGQSWEPIGGSLLEPDIARGEIGFGRPVLWHDLIGAPTLMLSIRRTDGYRLVETPWHGPGTLSGKFQQVLETGPEAWDAEMTCFGSPLKVGDHELLFYNGNRFGWSGFGIAWRSAVMSSKKDQDFIR